MAKQGNNFTQYSLLRGGDAKPVSILDTVTFTQMNIADEETAVISSFVSSLSLCQTTSASLMEALPSQQIMFSQPGFGYHAIGTALNAQSTNNFNRFQLKK
jgi:hypothetical protein